MNLGILFHEKHLVNGGINSPPPVFLFKYKNLGKQRSSSQLQQAEEPPFGSSAAEGPQTVWR